MASKSKKSNEKSSTGKTTTTSQDSAFSVSDENSIPPRCVTLHLGMIGESPGNGEFTLLTVFNGTTITEQRWGDGSEIGPTILAINLSESRYQSLIASNPIIFLLRVLGGKGAKQEPDPLLNSENRACATLDLLPLLMGEEEVFTVVRLVSTSTGEFIGCKIMVCASSPGTTDHGLTPLLITMVSAHCMPQARDGTVYISAIGLTDIYTPKALNFGMSLSTPDATKIVWSTVSSVGQGAHTEYSVPNEVEFIPDDLDPKEENELCRLFSWNSINRVLVDSEELIERLSAPFLIDVAGVPKVGKVDVRGRYMGWVDARALLEPAQLDVTVCSKLLVYNEALTQQAGGGLLDLPPTSAKTASARENDGIFDESGHAAYVVIKFDVIDPLVPKLKLMYLYNVIGFPLSEGPAGPVDELDTDDLPEEPFVDAKFVRNEAGALAVHKELSALACRGDVPMNQGIKRTAANRLLVRVRAMLKNFAPGNCSYIDWQDTVTGQHAASRRAVTASFAPQPPRTRLSDRVSAARCRIAGDIRLAEKHVKINLKGAGTHPRSLICKTLRCLEEGNDSDAKNYLLQALNSQARNRYLLWILGAQEFDKGTEGAAIAAAAFRISVKGDYSDGTANAIAWAALHSFQHANGNMYGAYIAVRKMRKAFSLPKEWKRVLKRWTDTSGEEEVYWTPGVIASDNPMLITAAFFLCLRCYKFCEAVLQCVENDCGSRGAHTAKYVPCVDVYYLRAAAFILKHQPYLAMEVTQKGIKKFGPSPMMSQMRVTCLSCIRGWDAECEKAFEEAESAGSKACPSILYKAALNGFKARPQTALQRAARVHCIAPSGHTALLIGRIYMKLGEERLAERWCAGAIKIEPLLSDAWAVLSLIAIYQQNPDKARTMLRTAKQVGPISQDIEEELKRLMNIVNLDQMPDLLVKNLCS